MMLKTPSMWATFALVEAKGVHEKHILLTVSVRLATEKEKLFGRDVAGILPEEPRILGP